MDSGKAVTKRFATREDLKTSFPRVASQTSGKEEASSLGQGTPRSLLLVESRYVLSLFCGSQCTRRGLLFLHCLQGTCCGLFDEMSDGLRLRNIHGVAAFDLDDR